MPFPLLGLLIGAAAGGLKSAAIDAPAAARERKLQAATTAFSPWTGLKGAAPRNVDPFGNMLKFGATGAGLEQSIGAADQGDEMIGELKHMRADQARGYGVNPWSDQRETVLPEWLRR